MYLSLKAKDVRGITDEERAMLDELLKIYDRYATKNKLKNKYYDGHISVGDVNLGLALPDGIAGFEIGCKWGGKTVDVLAARSMFDGFVRENGEPHDELNVIVADNNLIAEYSKACRDELKLGATLATLSKPAGESTCSIRFHPLTEAAAKWDGVRGRIGYGFAVLETEEEKYRGENRMTATQVGLYTDYAVIVLVKNGDYWDSYRFPHKMGRPLMEPLVHNATSEKPFGQSRLDFPVRGLIDSYVRTVANATIGLEFSTTPQKYLLGVTDAQYDALINDKFKQYVGSILASTTNPETGEKPTFGQLAQGTLDPHIQMLRATATQFSAATGLPITDTGVVNDANPTSADAIEAQTKTLVQMAQELNNSNASHLRMIAMMALAISRSTEDQDYGLADLDISDKQIYAHFKNPTMPSIAASADAAIKIASVRPEFAQTDVFLEMTGFDQAEVRRIKAQETKARGLALVSELVE